MSDAKFGLSDLVVSDDLDVSLDNEVYQDQANPAPPTKGNYRFRALSIDQKKARKGENEGQPILEAGKFPIFVLGQAEIIEGLGDGITRKVGLFHDIKTRPFDRFGSVASGIGDLTRSYGTANWRGLDPQDPDSGVSRLREAYDTNQSFVAQLDWAVYDSKFVEAALEQLADQIGESKETRSDDEKKVVNAIYNTARRQGQQNFPYNDANGKFSNVLVLENVTFKHPVSGGIVEVEVEHRTLEARPTLTRFYPAQEVAAGRVKIGPFNVKPAQRAA